MLDLERQADVVLERTPGQQQVALSQVAGPRIDAADLVAHVDDAPFGDGQQPGDGIHEGGLAAAAGPDEADEAALTDLEVDVLQRDERLTLAGLELD
jgi:hypothetical protein